MDSGDNELDELHYIFLGVITFVRLQMFTRLVGGCDTYNLEIILFEIVLIMNFIFWFNY